MRDPKRIATAIAYLHAAWQMNPDMRLGQLIENLAGPDKDLNQIWHTEDHEWIERLENYVRTGKFS